MKKITVLEVVLPIVWFGLGAGLWGPMRDMSSRADAGFSWRRVTDHAQFHIRDSAGELVYDGKMWLMGGWIDSNGPFPNDVWNSTDGVHWTCVTPAAAWTPVALPVTMVHDNQMWLMSGWYGGRSQGAHASNEVWHSTNGSDWTQATTAAPWAARTGAAGAVLNGRMWIMGGITASVGGTPLNDVWSSSDGVNWTQATAHAPWSPRGLHQALSFDNKLWVFGGGNYSPEFWSSNEVWNSSDGVNWTKVTTHAPWDPRVWFSAEVYQGRMWIMGGSGKSSGERLNDLWSSTDGINWTQLKTDTTWDPRHEMSSYVFDDKLWVVAGFAVAPTGLANDVWQIGITAPEPSTLALLTTAVIGTVAYAWRRRNGCSGLNH
jgi:hypothetical protein